MGIFFVLLLVPILIQHCEINGNKLNYQKRNNVALAFFFALLTFLVMFRHESIGNDTRNYIYFFNIYKSAGWNSLGEESLELGYAYFNKIVTLISTEPHFFLAFAALIVSLMIWPTYKRLCIDASLTIVLFCVMSTFPMLFSGIRQMLAIGIGCLAYEFTRRKQIVPFLLMVALAMSFHTTAFMLAFMYPLYYAKITNKWLLAVVPVIAVIFVFNRQIFTLLVYVLEQYTGYEGSISSTGAYTMLFLIVVFVAFAFLIPDETLLDQETIGLRNFLLLSLVIQLFAPLHSLAMRMSYYYMIFIPLLLPKIINCRKEGWRQVAVIGRHIMLVFFLVYFFINAYLGDALNVFPYHFFWESVG